MSMFDFASCREAARLSSEALDHPLSLRNRIELRTHMLVCGACRAYRRQLVQLDTLVRSRMAIIPTHGGGLSAQAQVRITAALRSSGLH